MPLEPFAYCKFLRGIHICVKSQEACIADFKTSPSFSESYEQKGLMDKYSAFDLLSRDLIQISEIAELGTRAI